MIATGQSLATTNQAANYLNIKPQTLHKWACYECGALQPVRVGRALRWRLSDIAALIAGGAK
ncbi:MAG: helix-turn-helix domain-containing protein [Gammaproteobacteria bacterium]|nr:helix-turn-helix domain-containing protein [Gammaproteobacteria bacterium]